MSERKTAYELCQSQVPTPRNVIDIFWQLTRRRRPYLGSVLDLGAGDARFAAGGHFRDYVGLEIDSSRVNTANLPRNGRIIVSCAFSHDRTDYDACIGNPPYLRHHDIEPPWKDRIVAEFMSSLGLRLNKKCNLFLYFMCLGLSLTRDDGLVALVVPYEWVSRPSAVPLREFIQRKRWKVDVYRFDREVFPDVLTTASITFIDKKKSSAEWSYFDLSENSSVTRRPSAAGGPDGVLQYASRGPLWAMRGLSPGSQAIFCLTEGERVHYGLSTRDVAPCVTTLRPVPRALRCLTTRAFQRLFVDAGERCWLLNSHKKHLHPSVLAYLESVPASLRDNYTCNSRNPWYRFEPHPIPRLLVSSGFTEFGPKVVLNSVGAQAVGSVTGIHGSAGVSLRSVQSYLLGIDFEALVVPHAKTLRKLEVCQLNATLNKFTEERVKHAVERH